MQMRFLGLCVMASLLYEAALFGAIPSYCAADSERSSCMIDCFVLCFGFFTLLVLSSFCVMDVACIIMWLKIGRVVRSFAPASQAPPAARKKPLENTLKTMSVARWFEARTPWSLLIVFPSIYLMLTYHSPNASKLMSPIPAKQRGLGAAMGQLWLENINNSHELRKWFDGFQRFFAAQSIANSSMDLRWGDLQGADRSGQERRCPNVSSLWWHCGSTYAISIINEPSRLVIW